MAVVLFGRLDLSPAWAFEFSFCAVDWVELSHYSAAADVLLSPVTLEFAAVASAGGDTVR